MNLVLNKVFKVQIRKFKRNQNFIKNIFKQKSSIFFVYVFAVGFELPMFNSRVIVLVVFSVEILTL